MREYNLACVLYGFETLSVILSEEMDRVCSTNRVEEECL
jgi:hypothetical protein